MKDTLKDQLFITIMTITKFMIISLLAYFLGFDFSDNANIIILILIANLGAKIDYYRAEENERNGVKNE